MRNGTENFLDYFASHRNEERCFETFINLIYCNIRRQNPNSLPVEILIAIALQDKMELSICASLRSTMELIIERTTNKDTYLLLALGAILTKCFSDAGNIRILQRLKLILPESGLRMEEESPRLLLALYQNDIQTLSRQIIQVFDWSKGKELLASVFNNIPLELLDVALLESLSELVLDVNDFSKFLELFNCLSITRLDHILCAHDLLIKLNYPKDCTNYFIRLLKKVLDCQEEQPRWVLSNICSNAERLLFRLEDLAENAHILMSIISITSGLCQIVGSEVDKLLKAIVATVKRSSNLMSEALVSEVALLHTANRNIHRNISGLLWSNLCKSIATHQLECIKPFLDSFEESNEPWLLIDPLLFALVDLKKDLFYKYGSRTLKAIFRLVELSLSNSAKFITLDRGTADNIYIHSMSLVRTPLNSVSLAHIDFARSNYDAILQIAASIILYQIGSGWKDWSRIMSEFSPFAPWLQYGKSGFHMRILPSMYRIWISYVNRLPISINLVTDYLDSFVGIALQAHFQANFSESRILLTTVFGSHELEKAKKYLDELSEPKLQMISSMVFRSLKCYLDLCGDEIDAEYLQQLFDDLKRLGLSMPPHILSHILELSTIVSCNVSFLVTIASLLHQIPSQEIIDKFDLILDWFCSQPSTPCDCCTTTSAESVDFTLRRLTAVYFSRPNFQTDLSPNFKLLMGSLIRASPIRLLEKYIAQLFALDADNNSNYALLHSVSHITLESLTKERMISDSTLATIMAFEYPEFVFDIGNKSSATIDSFETINVEFGFNNISYMQDNIDALILSTFLRKGEDWIHIGFKFLDHLTLRSQRSLDFVAEAGLFEFCDLHHPLHNIIPR